MKQLPLFADKAQLPTGKWHISFSELSNWYECSYRHKLKYVDKIDFDGPSVHTIFGHIIHGALEEYAVTKKFPSFEELIEEFKKQVGELLFTENAVTPKDAQEFIDALPDMIEQVPGWLDEEFPGWKVVSAEELLFEPITGQTNRYFKGFIDLVIKVPKRKKSKGTRLSSLKGEEIPGEWEYQIIDWKTTSWGWRAEQKRSFLKHMQLIFYKYFWCTKHGVDLKDAKAGFAFIKRRPSKDGSRLELLSVSVGPKAVAKALDILNNCINQISSGMYQKNKMSCRFCRYAGTKYCP